MVEETKVDVGYGKCALIAHEGFHVGGAVLEIEAGKKTDMIFHLFGGKLLYLLSGKLKVMVLKDGVVNSINVPAGASFYIRPGLVYQLEAIEKALAIEFAQVETFTTDISCVVKGTQTQKAIDMVQSATAEAKKVGPAAPVVAQPAKKPEAPVAVEPPATKKRQTRKKKGLN